MKRDRDRGKASAAPVASTDKSKKWEEEEQMWQQQANSGMDELFAVLGYKVKSSDMANVAQKLQQLEMVMMGLTTTEDGVSVLNDTVHYNPSDLSGWVESMLSELNNSNSSIISGESSSNIIYDDDLRAIPGGAVFGNNQKDVLYDEKDNKRIKSASGSEFTDNVSLVEPSRSVVLVDSQETGVRLVHTLMACAEAVQQENCKLAEALVKHVGLLTVSQVGAMKKVATCFAEALARKIYKIYPQESLSYSDVLQMHFYETGPYLKFAHFTANQAILEAFAGANRVHVIDFSLQQGMQWPALMQALALRPGGPPEFRLTGIGPPQPDNKDDALQHVQGRTQTRTYSNLESDLELVGWKLAQLAKTIGVEFEFKGFVVNSLADLDAKKLHIKPSNVEALAVNSVFELHRLLARPNAIEKVLDSIKSMNPKIMTIAEQEADHNGNVFLERFNEALHYYSTMFDSLESSSSIDPNSQDLVMTEVYLGRQICDVVACEGPERVERHETLAQWRVRLGSAGFDAVHLGSNAFKQASMLLALFAVGDGYRVEENDGCLMLGWHNRPLIATSAWRIKAE